eukprot:gene14680-20717_t
MPQVATLPGQYDGNAVTGVLRPGIVHRLDKGTTGLMVVAKQEVAHRGLCEQFKSRTVERTYWSIAMGVPKETEGRVEANIGRDPAERKRQSASPYGGTRGRLAASSYRILEELAAGSAALVEWKLDTGRTHQIRVHAKYMGHPLLGDDTYGGSTAAAASIIGRGKALRQVTIKALVNELGRPALHAKTLGFTHPVTGERLRFDSEPPADLQKANSSTALPFFLAGPQGINHSNTEGKESFSQQASATSDTIHEPGLEASGLGNDISDLISVSSDPEETGSTYASVERSCLGLWPCLMSPGQGEASQKLAWSRSQESLHSSPLFIDYFSTALLKACPVPEEAVVAANLAPESSVSGRPAHFTIEGLEKQCAVDTVCTKYMDEALMNALRGTNLNSISGGDYRQGLGLTNENLEKTCAVDTVCIKYMDEALMNALKGANMNNISGGDYRQGLGLTNENLEKTCAVDTVCTKYMDEALMNALKGANLNNISGGDYRQGLGLTNENLEKTCAVDPVCTKYTDEALMNALRGTNLNSISGGDYRQVILLGDGFDTRPFRLPWPESTIIFLVASKDVQEVANKSLAADSPLTDLLVEITNLSAFNSLILGELPVKTRREAGDKIAEVGLLGSILDPCGDLGRIYGRWPLVLKTPVEVEEVVKEEAVENGDDSETTEAARWIFTSQVKQLSLAEMDTYETHMAAAESIDEDYFDNFS